MTRFGWGLWATFVVLFVSGSVGTCLYQGRPLWWWPAWAFAAALSAALMILLRRLRM